MNMAAQIGNGNIFAMTTQWDRKSNGKSGVFDPRELDKSVSKQLSPHGDGITAALALIFRLFPVVRS